MLYIIGDLVPFEICNMLPLIEEIAFEEVIEGQTKDGILYRITLRALDLD